LSAGPGNRAWIVFSKLCLHKHIVSAFRFTRAS